MSAPEPGTPEYQWWEQGAMDEVNARNEGMSQEHQNVRTFLEGLARLRPELSSLELVMRVASVYMAGQPLPQRLKHVWRLIR